MSNQIEVIYPLVIFFLKKTNQITKTFFSFIHLFISIYGNNVFIPAIKALTRMLVGLNRS